MSPPLVRLRMDARFTVLEFDDGRLVTLPVGPSGLVEAVLQHDPPTPAELERAIDVIEDALTGWPVSIPRGGWLVTPDASLSVLPGFDTQGNGLGLARDAVEILFQRLVSRSLGTPVASAELPHGRDIAAALLILRECMHHLDFGQVNAAFA